MVMPEMQWPTCIPVSPPEPQIVAPMQQHSIPSCLPHAPAEDIFKANPQCNDNLKQSLLLESPNSAAVEFPVSPAFQSSISEFPQDSPMPVIAWIELPSSVPQAIIVGTANLVLMHIRRLVVSMVSTARFAICAHQVS